MTQATARAPFNSSRLTHFLHENAMLEETQATGNVAQKLADWLDFRQAIALHGVLHPDESAEALSVPARHTARLSSEALVRHVDKIGAQLAQSILQGAPAGSGLTRIDMPALKLDEAIDPTSAYEPYRRFHAAHQRQMETVLRSLRAQMRTQLSRGTAPLQRLALLDAAFENILGEREALLLTKWAKLLEKRFVQALRLHMKNLMEAQPDADIRPSLQAWLMTWQQQLRKALLDELDTRMLPTLGLLEAFQSDTSDAP